jgi:succinate-semialdehyde dehydrogenase/glutarate-semialdehyde dehydrogenase
MSMKSVNPATGQVLREYAVLGDDDLETVVERAVSTQKELAERSVDRRAEWLLRAADGLHARREELARLMTAEMGKTFASALAEVDKCGWVCRYYAENAASFLSDEVVDSGARESRIRYEPLGVVLAIMPWNFPLWQVFRFAAPALVAGNAGLLKHAANVPGCSLAIESVFSDAGFPPGAFQSLLIPAARAETLVADHRIAAVTLTGSEPAGRAVARAAGQNLKKSVLELDPFIVLADADIEGAVETAVQARIINNGQSCIAAKRFIVSEEIAVEFETRFIERMEALTTGDPMDPGTDIGPLATEAIRTELHEQVRRSVAAGAHLSVGGTLPTGPGFFYPPRCSGSGRRPRPSHWQTPRTSVSVRPYGLAMTISSRFSSKGCRPAPCSSTEWWPPIPGYRSAESNARDTGVSWGYSGCASSSTSRRCGSATEARIEPGSGCRPAADRTGCGSVRYRHFHRSV